MLLPEIVPRVKAPALEAPGKNPPRLARDGVGSETSPESKRVRGMSLFIFAVMCGGPEVELRNEVT